VVVDEAQDLSPMQLRMLARRTPEGSMTVLGDLGQATGVWAHDDWDEVLEHLPNAAGARVDELTLGYRVSAAIMDVASAILREAAPRLTPPTAVRREAGDVSFVSSEEAARASDVVRASSGMLDRLGSCAVIVPASILDETRHALRSAGLPLGEADHRDLTHPVTLVPVARCKGLEFEGVVVVEPAFVVEEAGLRMLYVAVTRAMRSLAVVHAEPLPDALRAVGSPATLRAG
jgi:DNA helicase IV